MNPIKQQIARGLVVWILVFGLLYLTYSTFLPQYSDSETSNAADIAIGIMIWVLSIVAGIVAAVRLRLRMKH